MTDIELIAKLRELVGEGETDMVKSWIVHLVDELESFVLPSQKIPDSVRREVIEKPLEEAVSMLYLHRGGLRGELAAIVDYIKARAKQGLK